ncbi:MAG TPA: glycosyltransferase family 2 protein [Terriglobia bacterium]|jgi:GT2 family glycosyltransferase
MSSKLRVLPYVVLLLPLDLFVAVCLAAAVVAGTFKRGLKPATTFNPVVAGFSPRCTILIVSWDGRHLLAESLPSVIGAIEAEGGGHEVMVVDNGSADGSVGFIREHFPTVRVLPLDRNYGFSEGNNRGVAEITTDTVIFLNNDMIVERNFLRPLLHGFSDPSVFAVTSQIFFQDSTRRREETGKTRARFQNGAFYFWHDEIGPEDDQRETIPVFWAGGGSCAVDRLKFLELGGFDALYHPFYVEDTDLSYQAWKRGWKCHLAPASRVVHKHRGTTQAKFSNDFVDNTIRKNQYLFIWKNVTDAAMIFEHILSLPRIHARSMRKDPDPMFETRAYLRAIGQLAQALQRRIANQAAYTISDKAALERSQKP